MKKYIMILCAIMAMVSCGTQKSAVETSSSSLPKNDAAAAKERTEYVQRVNNNAVTAQNVVAKIDFSINAMDQDITVDGKLQMRRNEVIRITLAPFGLMEVGRLEFTPSGVLLIDRINKQYVNATYNDLEFLRSNGLNFYSLQALFWNEMFAPGQQTMNETALKQLNVNPAEQNRREITMSSGKLNFTWTTSPADALINKTMVEYDKGSKNASRAIWMYDNFKALGNKKFPTNHTLRFRSVEMDKEMSVNISMGRLSEDASWEAKTEVSGKYQKVSAEEILRKLTNL